MKLQTVLSEPEHGEGSSNFAQAERFVSSWYPVLPSAKLRCGKVLSRSLLGRRIAVYRTEAGVAHAIDARCPHLGADLGLGTVTGESVRCAFHGWCISGADCKSRPLEMGQGRGNARSYPLREKYGLIWIFNGERALFEIPDVSPDLRFSLRFPEQRINCHPHLVLGNGLDVTHFDALHGFEFLDPPQLRIDPPYSLHLSLKGRPRSRFLQWLTRSQDKPIIANFSTLGASLAIFEILSPLRFSVIFTGKPEAAGCLTKTILLFPSRSPVAFAQMLTLLAVLLHSDRKVLDSLDFQANFGETDKALTEYAKLIDRMPTG